MPLMFRQSQSVGSARLSMLSCARARTIFSVCSSGDEFHLPAAAAAAIAHEKSMKSMVRSGAPTKIVPRAVGIGGRFGPLVRQHATESVLSKRCSTLGLAATS